MLISRSHGSKYLLAAWLCFATLLPAVAAVQRNDNSDIFQVTGVPLYEWKDDRVEKPRKILVAVHGFAQQGGALSAIALKYARQGYLVVAPDLRGHGRWPETDATMEENLQKSCDDLAKLLAQLHKRYKKADIYCIGESTGSGVLMSAIAKQDRGIRAVVLCAAGSQPAFHNPAVMGVSFIKGMASMVSQVDIKSYLQHYLSDDPRVAREMIDDPLAKKSQSALQLLGTMSFIREMPKRASELPASIPVLVMQGSEDQIVNAESAQAVFDSLKTDDKNFVVVPGSGHILVGTAYIKPAVAKAIDDWLLKHDRGKSRKDTN
ncbi:MAG: hypothetical protein C0507_10910 [Cyanobacteria bacterium PR.3.49]|nr:hypothetical protein [Cyanobacteria bacterium PR.3.49]